MKTVAEWRDYLWGDYLEALEGLEPDTLMSPDEVMDDVVAYVGGLASGYQVRSLYEAIYEIEQEEPL